MKLKLKKQTKLSLPKQWKHWCSLANLHRHGRPWRKGDWSWFYLKGQGRTWRVSNKPTFQCGDIHEEFDRWALCDIQEAPVPKTKAEFLATVKALLEAHEKPIQNWDYIHEGF